MFQKFSPIWFPAYIDEHIIQRDERQFLRVPPKNERKEKRLHRGHTLTWPAYTRGGERCGR